MIIKIMKGQRGCRGICKVSSSPSGNMFLIY